MATRTNGAGYVSIPTGGLPTSADNWSWCGWFERVGDQGAESIIVNFAGTAGTIGQLRINSDGDSIVVGNQSALSGTLHTLTNGAPVFLAISCNAGTMTAYARLIGGGSFATVTLARSSYTVSTSTLHGMTWGWQANGRLSHSKWFSRAVTEAEWGDQWDSEDVTAALSGVCVGDVRLEGANLTEALTATVGSNLTSSGTVTVEALSVNPFPVAFSYDGAIELDLAISSAGALQLTRAGSVGLPLAISATAISSATFTHAGSVGLALSTSAISAATALYQYAGTIALPLAVAGAYAQNDALVYLGTVALPLSISAAVDYEAELATLDIPLEWQITVPPPTAHYTTTGAISLALGVQAAVFVRKIGEEKVHSIIARLDDEVKGAWWVDVVYEAK